MLKKSLFLVVLFIIPCITHAQTAKTPLECLEYAPLVKQYDWNWQIALKVMYAESGCNSEAVNLKDIHYGKIYPRDYPLGYCRGSFGLMQTSCNDLISYDPAINIAVAYQVYKLQGWKAWGSCKKLVKCYY